MTPYSDRSAVLLICGFLFLIAPCAGPVASESAAPATAQRGLPPVASAPLAVGSEHAGLVMKRLERRGRRLTPDERHRVAHTILEASRRYDVSPALVLAVIEIESAYNPHAVSPVGALGLMQIMPRTGQELAERTGETWQGTGSLFEPELNIRLGVAYLRELIDRYDSVRAALAAYNWGPGRIDGFLRNGSGLPAEYPDLVLGAYSRVSGSPIGS